MKKQKPKTYAQRYPIGAARTAIRELICDYERSRYRSSYEDECLVKLKVIRRALYQRKT